jgi:hypothetical protein
MSTLGPAHPALLVPTPTRDIRTAIRDILHDHNPLEEGLRK